MRAVFINSILALYGVCFFGIGFLIFENHHYHPHCAAGEIVVKGEWHAVCAVGHE